MYMYTYTCTYMYMYLQEFFGGVYICRESEVSLLLVHEREEVRRERVRGGRHSVGVGEGWVRGGSEGGSECGRL